jgi:hypothetical protein
MLDRTCDRSVAARQHSGSSSTLGLHEGERIQTPLSGEIIYTLKHFIRRLYHAGAGLVGALGHNHLNKLLDYIDVRLLEESLLDGAQTFRAAGSSENGIA